ncbi:MAG: LssY C-terminal domain-containing protein [Nocardioides sp.]
MMRMGVEPADNWRRGVVVDTPPPSSPPTFELAPDAVSGIPLWPVQEILDGAFFVIGTALVMWLGWIVAAAGFDGWFAIGSVFLFWVLLAYVGLPRLQEVLSKVYVPDYFIGRSLTEVGVLGDPINLALDGGEADIHDAMTRAGWVRAEELTIRSSWRIVVSSVFRRPYPEAPVSSLFLFGQRQSFAYQQEVDGNASQRHHVRFWPVPDGWTLPGGFRVGWLAAATYDKAVGISLFTLQVTHRVDADIDIERDYVINTVRYAEPKASLRVIKEYSNAFTTRNGGGDVVRTDGSLPILDLTALQAHEPDKVEPATDALSRAVSHRVPPPGLLAAGVMSMAKALIPLTAVLVAVLRGESPSAHASTLELTVMGSGALCLIGLWVFMLAHHAWARIALMVVCTVEAITQLIDLSADAEVKFLVLMNAAITVLILIAVSSNEARRWVRLGRRS